MELLDTSGDSDIHIPQLFHPKTKRGYKAVGFTSVSKELSYYFNENFDFDQ